MSQNTSPDYVPSAKQGTAVSLAAPGRVGAGDTICKLCGYAHTSIDCPSDEQVVSWYDGQSDEFLVDLQEQRNAWTPREAWNAFFIGAVVREANKAAWLSISNFLATQNLRMVLQARERDASAQAQAAGQQRAAAALGAAHSIPVGNHGEIVAMGVGV